MEKSKVPIPKSVVMETWTEIDFTVVRLKAIDKLKSDPTENVVSCVPDRFVPF